MMPAQGNAEDKRRRTKKKKQLLLDAEEQTKKIVATLYPNNGNMNMIVCLATEKNQVQRIEFAEKLGLRGVYVSK